MRSVRGSFDRKCLRVIATDFDAVFIERNKARTHPRWSVTFKVHDMMAGPLAENFDGVYAIDVIEHIPVEHEDRFVGNLAASLNPQGVCLIGSPSLQSQAYATKASKAGHVNCKDAPRPEGAHVKILSQRFHLSR